MTRAEVGRFGGCDAGAQGRVFPGPRFSWTPDSGRLTRDWLCRPIRLDVERLTRDWLCRPIRLDVERLSHRVRSSSRCRQEQASSRVSRSSASQPPGRCRPAQHPRRITEVPVAESELRLAAALAQPSRAEMAGFAASNRCWTRSGVWSVGWRAGTG